MRDRLDIDRIAFIGRTFREYSEMFALDESAIRSGPVLDCPAGAASFAAEAHRMGIDVAACDILYDRPVEELASKGEKDIAHIYEKVGEASHLYAWEYYKNRDELIAFRKRALESFLADFPEGLGQGRYVRAELPRLPFPDGAFQLLLSSHFLFLYGDRLDLDFHVASLRELLRVSEEVRVFPLHGLDARPSPHLGKAIEVLAKESVKIETLKVPFEFQRGANEMLRISKRRQAICRR